MSIFHYKITGDNEDFKRKMQENSRLIRESANEAEKVSSGIQRQVKAIGVATVGIFSAQAVKGFIDDVRRVRGEFQQLEIAFETMLGSKEKADALMRQAVSTAAKTPFDLNQVASGYKQLLAYGIGVEKLNDTLVTLGDVASGVGAPLNDIVYLYGTLNASGRVALMDIRQFAGRGIPIYEELAKVLGIAKEQVNDFASAGKISFEHVELAFKNMASEGGRFANLMEKQSASIGGLKANLGDAVDMMKNELGQKLQPLFEKTLQAQIYIVENYEAIGKTILGLVVAYGSYKAVLITVSAIESNRRKILALINGMAKVQMSLNKALTKSEAVKIVQNELLTKALYKQAAAQIRANLAALANPYVLVAAALAALVYGIYKLVTADSAAESAQKQHNEELKKAAEAKENLLSKTNSLVAAITDETKTIYQQVEAWRELKKEMPDSFGKMTLSEFKTMKPEDRDKLINNSAEKQSQEQFFKSLEEAEKRVANLKDGLNQAMRIPGNSGAVSYYTKQLEQAEELLKLKQAEKQKREEIAREAEFEALTDEKKIARLNQQLKSYREQYAEIEKQVPENMRNADAVNSVTNSAGNTKTGITQLNAEWGKFDAQTFNNILQLNALNGNIQEIETTISGINSANSAGMTYAQAKTQAKKEYDDAQKALDDIKKNATKYTKKQYEDAALTHSEKKKTYEELGGVTNVKSADGKTKAEKERELAAFKDLEEKQAREQARAAVDATNAVEQSRIYAMKKSSEKTLAQMALDHKKELEQLDRESEDFLQRKIDNAKALFEANPANKGKAFDGSNIQLTESENNDFANRQKNIRAKHANEDTDFINEQIKRDQEAWNRILQEYGTYQEKRLAIAEEYNRKIAEAETGGEKEELRFQRDSAMTNLDIDEFKKSINFADIFSNIDEKSTASVQALRDKLAQHINEAAAGLTPDQLKPLSDALLGLDKALKERKPAQGLTQSISAAKKAFADLKKAKDDGLSDDTVKKFENTFKDAMAKVASNISVVLGHLNDFGGIAQNLVGVFNDDAADMIGDLIGIAAGAGQAGMGVAKLASGGIIGGMKDLAKGITEVVGGIIRMNDKAKERKIKEYQKQIDDLDQSYKDLERSLDEYYSTDKAQHIEMMKRSKEKQKELIRMQIEQEKSKKKTDWSKIKQWENEIKNIDGEIKDLGKKAEDAIFGQGIQNAIENFASAYVNAWAAGEDRMKSSREVAKNMIKAMIVEAIKGQVSASKIMEKIRSQMKSFMENDGIIDDYEQSILDEMIEGLTKQIDDKFGWADKYLKGKGAEQGAASYGAYEKVTQEQADKIDGILTGMHMIMVENSGTFKSLDKNLDETRGLTLMMVEELQGINKNTKMIKDTNEKLDKIIKNTEKI